MVDSTESPVTLLLSQAEAGDPSTAGRLLPLLYEELRSLAAKRLSAERPGQTLQPTALVHEAYLRLIGEADLKWENRGHFFAAAAQAMRRILVDRARARATRKRGGGFRKVTMADMEQTREDRPEELLALDSALDRLAALDQRKADIVMLRYFSGLTVQQTAEILALSPTTIKDEWKFAKSWLYGEINRRG